MDVVMPKMGESVSEGTIIKWYKQKGDKVERDEIIFEISTDKVDTEIPSPTAGVLEEILVNEGDTVEVGTVVAKISGNGESTSNQEETSAGNEIKEEEAEEQEKEETVANNDDVQDDKKDEETDTEIQLEVSSDGDLLEIKMPKMGESVMEGTIIKWYKKVGDKVKKDETLFEISTDKVDTEVPSPEEGTLAEILVGEQETVEVDTVVAKLSSGSGTQKKKEKTDDQKSEKKETSEEPVSMHDNFRQKKTKTEDEKDSGDDGFYSPLVLNIANKENVSFDELRNIDGTGLNGRVTKKDILGYLEDRKSGKTKPKSEPTPEKKEDKKETKGAPAPSFAPSETTQKDYSGGGIEEIQMDNIRQKIMQHMVMSRDTSVHVSAMLEVDMTKIHNFIQKNKDKFYNDQGVKLTYMAFVADATVKALKKYPLVNSSIDGDKIIQKKFVNLGIAVAIEPTGLIVPNIKGAGDRNITGLAKAINDLAYRSRNKKLTPDDISNGTFTITNYGVFGTIFGTPIINQPEVAILGVGAVQKKPVVIEVDGADTFAVRNIMALTLSHDHRLVDGMLGGVFLKYIKDTLEEFDSNTVI